MSLRVIIDGEALPEAEARAFWTRFSDYMEANRGDLAGFAKSEGLASVHPKMSAEGALLVGSQNEIQKPYANAPSIGSSRGSPPAQPDRHGHGGQARAHAPKGSKKPKK